MRGDAVSRDEGDVKLVCNLVEGDTIVLDNKTWVLTRDPRPVPQAIDGEDPTVYRLDIKRGHTTTFAYKGGAVEVAVADAFR